MSSNARRKEKHRLKREKKKAAQRRAMSVSPYKRIGQAGAVEACYINSDWQEGGMAAIFVVRWNPAGGYAVGGFQIDLWCAGLKDAWGRLDFAHDEMEKYLERTQDRFTLVRIEPEAARSLVAGAIRFAIQNGFRLPKHYQRWTALLGDIGDIHSADLRGFGKDGGLLWVGPMEHLRQRLIGCTVEDFFSRPNVHFISEMDGSELVAVEDEEDDPEIDEAYEDAVDHMSEEITQLANKMSEAMRQRCLSRGEEFTSEMSQAVHHLLTLPLLEESLKVLRSEPPDDLASKPVPIPLARETIRQLSENMPDQFSESMKEAAARVMRLMIEMNEELGSLVSLMK